MVLQSTCSMKNQCREINPIIWCYRYNMIQISFLPTPWVLRRASNLTVAQAYSQTYLQIYTKFNSQVDILFVFYLESITFVYCFTPWFVHIIYICEYKIQIGPWHVSRGHLNYSSVNCNSWFAYKKTEWNLYMYIVHPQYSKKLLYSSY